MSTQLLNSITYRCLPRTLLFYGDQTLFKIGRWHPVVYLIQKRLG